MYLHLLLTQLLLRLRCSCSWSSVIPERYVKKTREMLAAGCWTPHQDADDSSKWCRNTIYLAREKLLCERPETPLEGSRHEDSKVLSREAKAAVLDVRLHLSYEPSRSSMFESNLVASHMRTVSSIPRHRHVMRSGYPSEAILAEAATHQLHFWDTQMRDALSKDMQDEGADTEDMQAENMETEDAQAGAEDMETIDPQPRNTQAKDERAKDTQVKDKQTTENRNVHPSVLILRDLLSADLLSLGEIGEVVGRLHLLRARDAAVIRESRKKFSNDRPDSRPVSVQAFFEELLSEEIKEHFFDSRPDQLLDGQPFNVAFANACINFNHFAKWERLAELFDQRHALYAFVRGAAIICPNGAASVDCYTPILKDKDGPLVVSNMTFAAFQFKLRTKKSSIAGTSINAKNLGFFPVPETSPRNNCGQDNNSPPLHPYITIIMDLGLSKRKEFYHIPSPPQRSTCSTQTSKSIHLRYSLFLYGCSRMIYGKEVIRSQDEEQIINSTILRRGKVLAEHPRQGKAYIETVLKLLPSWTEPVLTAPFAD